MSRHKFKEALKQLDSPQRTALLYLEKLILKQSKLVITTTTKTDFTEVNKRFNSLQKQIDNLKNMKNEFKKAQRQHQETITLVNEGIELNKEFSKLHDRLLIAIRKEFTKKPAQIQSKMINELTNSKLMRHIDKRKE